VRSTVCLAAVAASLCALPMPAMAQDETADVAAMRAEIVRLRAQLEQLEGRLNKVETQASAPPPPAAAPVATAPQQVAAAAPETSITWRGAPQFSNGKGVTFKPRGRLQLDTSYVSRPRGTIAPTLGWSSDVRRAYLGVDGALGGGFGYRLEVDFASGSALLTDAWLTYEKGAMTVTIGHQKTFGGLDELTSDLETSLLERASFTQAFGFERRLGVSVALAKGDFLLNAGAFADDLETMGTSLTDDSFSLDGRLAYMPKLGDTQLHFAGSLHHRQLQSLLAPLRYRARPGARTTDIRFVDTGTFSATSETGYGLEFALGHGPFHLASEAFWQHVDRPNFSDPTFFGGYGEIGYVFAGGKGRSYSKGTFGAVRPTKGLDKGGSGAWQVNLRYDWLDLNDASIRGGTQRTLGASLVWVPVEHVKFLANYLRISVEDTPVLIGALNDYDVDVFGLRAQYDF
jgi:phosphate-selective porin OprO/OprP